MEKLLESQLKRTKQLMKSLEVVKVMGRDDQSAEDLCNSISASLNRAEGLLEKRKSLLSRKKQLCDDMDVMIKKMSDLGDRVEEVTEAVFPESSFQQCPTDSIEEHSSNEHNSNNLDVSPCPSEWGMGFLDTPMNNAPINNRPQGAAGQPQLPRIRPISSNEFESVPMYLKGRLTVENINSFVGTLNSVLNQKYSIAKLKRKDVKRKDLTQYLSWKSQEEGLGLSGKFFFTPEDMLALEKFKLDKIADKMIQILRHIKRLRESRATGKKILYILI